MFQAKIDGNISAPSKSEATAAIILAEAPQLVIPSHTRTDNSPSGSRVEHSTVSEFSFVPVNIHLAIRCLIAAGQTVQV